MEADTKTTNIHEDLEELEQLLKNDLEEQEEIKQDQQKKKRKKNKKKKNQQKNQEVDRNKRHFTPLKDKMNKSL